jgi:hypothetical protein
MDVLERMDNDLWRIHLRSRRPFTNEIGANLCVFFHNLIVDMTEALKLDTIRDEVIADGVALKAARYWQNVKIVPGT